jgi:ribosomal protein S27AE
MEKTKDEAKIKVEEVKEPETPTEEVKPTLTVKDRVNNVIDKYGEDKEELKKQVFQLVQRILFPEQFCPSCDERMFFDPTSSSYSCPNCGYKSQPVVQTTARPTIPVAPGVRPTGPVPPQVEKIIAEANENMKDVPIPTRKTALGDKIRKLVNDRDAGGSSVPTKEAESQLRGADKNAAAVVNWV